MPRRTNTFQEVVTIIHRQLAKGAPVEESAMLVDRVTGDEKEVDAVIRSKVAGQDIIVSVEATRSKVSRPWVESMIGKHKNLDTHRLVLVSERGASPAAFRMAAAENVALLVPETLSGDNPVLKVVGRLESVWPKGVTLTLERVWITVQTPEGLSRIEGDAPDDLAIYDLDGRALGTPPQVFTRMFGNNWPWIFEEIKLADIAEDRDEYFLAGWGEPDTRWADRQDETPRAIALQWTATEELHQIANMEFTGRAVIQVTEMRLTHWRLGDTAVAYGEARVGDENALLVIGEDESGTRATMKLSPDAKTGDGASSAGYEVQLREMSAEEDTD